MARAKADRRVLARHSRDFLDGKHAVEKDKVALEAHAEELEAKVAPNHAPHCTPNCKFCLISHMRGKLADMNAVKDACDRHCITLLKDCAHSLAVYWNSVHTGHVRRVAAISAQS